MAQAGMSISTLIAALSYGKEIQEIKQKFCTELEQEEEVLSLRTKAEVRELAEDISNKIVKLSQLKKEKKAEIDQDDFLDKEDQKILQAYIKAEKEAIQLGKDINAYLSPDAEGVKIIREKYLRRKDAGHALETSATSVESSSKAGKQKTKAKCPTCGKLYHQNYVEEHKRSCGKERQKFECPQCKKTFLTKSYLEGHIKSCDGQSKSKVCPKCAKGMYRKITVSYKFEID